MLISGIHILILLALCCSRTVVAEDWPQNAGPHGNWSTSDNAPVSWSVVNDRNIVWKTELPEGGQSSVTVWRDRCFLTCHAELSSTAEAKTSTDIVGYCLDVSTGRVLWKIPVPGRVAVGTAGIFSDATVFAPVTDGDHVWFFNRSGGIVCCNFEGGQVWHRQFTPRNRHTNRQAEPFLFGNQLVVVEVADKQAGARIRRHAPVPDDLDPRSVWTVLHGLNKNTGEVLWTGSAGTVCHNAPVIGRLKDGTPAIVHGRGGGHGPLEKPYGLSLTSLAAGSEGQPLWSVELAGLDPAWQCHWTEDAVVAFQRQDHVTLDPADGKELTRRSLVEDVTVHSLSGRGWTRQEHVNYAVGKKKPNTNQTNILVGDWHYFLAHDRIAIGRVHIHDGRVEYLEVPVQIAVESGQPARRIRDSQNAIPIETLNSRGIDIAPDKRARRTGWGHVSAASPILAGRYLYFPVMTGTVYVIDAHAEQFDGDALVAINDLGPAGQTWTLSSFSCSEHSLYIRTMKHVFRIAAP